MRKQQRSIRSGILKTMGIETTSDFIEACVSPEKRGELASLLGVSEARVDGWLAMVYPNHKSAVAAEVAGQLECAGVVVLKPRFKPPVQEPGQS